MLRCINRVAALNKDDRSRRIDAQDDNQPEHQKTILIKKYPNRRLYNTDTSSYIVLDDIVELIRADTLFKIEDKKTGEDITRSILNQIIFERETKPSNYHFPLEVQKQLISMYGDAYGKMVPNYLTESMKLFVSERTHMAEAVEDVLGRNTRAMMEYSQELARQNMELFRRSWDAFGSMGGALRRDAHKSSETKGEEPSRETELASIQAQIDALQERLKSLK